MICSCCGFIIEGETHLINNRQKQVCDKCWNNPKMFFAEKIPNDQRLSFLSTLAKTNLTKEEFVEIKAIRLSQKNIDMYIGKMKVSDILALYELDKFKDEQLEGYQRERYEERTSQLVEYLEKSPLAVMPALLVGLRKTNFITIDGDLGKLKIEQKKGSMWIIDGQHRIGGFSKIQEQFYFSQSLGVGVFNDLMNFEMPVVFVDSNGAAQKLQTKEDNSLISPEDIEKTIFYIVNKTQRGISPSLKDALSYSIKTSGIEGLSLVDKEGWRIVGAEIGITLNRKETSPLRGKINVSGQRNSGKPIQLNSFVSSLQFLFKEKEFSSLPATDKIDFLEAYWLALKILMPQALTPQETPKELKEEFGHRFASNIGRKAKRKNGERRLESQKSLLLSALGIYVVHRIAKDLLHVAIKEGVNYREKDFFVKELYPIKGFDWSAKTSPLSALGGMKGVSKAYELLARQLNLEIDSNSKSLAEFSP
jgi:DGQHR domain-containing protein